MQLRFLFLFILSLFMTFPTYAINFIHQEEDPAFSEYPTPVVSGPFAKNLILNDAQKGYSRHLKNTLQKELNLPVNFAGHHRLYIAYDGGHEEECGFKRGVCGWVIDKLTGRIVTTLPSMFGNKIYSPYIINNTPVPPPFYDLFRKNSALLVIVAQVMPKPRQYNENGDFIEGKCGASYHYLDKDSFKRILENEINCYEL